MGFRRASTGLKENSDVHTETGEGFFDIHPTMDERKVASINKTRGELRLIRQFFSGADDEH